MFAARLFAIIVLGFGIPFGLVHAETTDAADTAYAMGPPLPLALPLPVSGAPGSEIVAPLLVEPLPANDTLQADIPIQLPEDLPPPRTIDLTTPPDDLWQRVRNGFAMPDLASPLVADRQAWYLNRPEMLRQILERSRRYLYHIVAELEKRGMPTELALLPVVESAYNPLAYSSARALGMWQFIPSTGKNYRLQQNWWLDQRRDIVASTSAALDYLQTIYEMNGDWHLALASYNWGEHAVARAVINNRAKGMPTDYLHLKMPGETRYYVPKLQALKNIIAQPELFHIKLDPVPNRPYFGTVARSSNMDVSIAAKLAEIPVDEFIALNPAYNRPVMPAADGSPLVLPADKVDTFVANLERYQGEDKSLSDWQTYTLKKGERIDAVASRFGLSGARLRQINGISSRTRIVPGHALLVPGKGAMESANQVAAKLPPMPPEGRRSGRKSSKSKAHGKRHGAAKSPKKPVGTKHKKQR
jgi:membrane-bound lytic murein transglycosylase D